MLPTTFRSIWPSCFRVEDFQKLTNQKQELPVWRPCLLMDRDKMSNLYREPSIDASYQSLDSFGKAVSEHKIFRNRPIRNKNCLWQPYLLTDRDEMSNLYRGPPIDASYQVRFIWQCGFRGEDFLEINQSETRIVCGGHVCQWIGTK